MKIDIKKKFQHLSRAPIVEAVIEIRFTNESEYNEENILSLIEKSLTNYPNHEKLRGFTQLIEFGSEKIQKQEPVDLGFKGYRFNSSDKLQIIIFGKDNFVFSRLAPYEQWEKFFNEGIELWNFYKNLIKIGYVNRIGVRFINNIIIPGKTIDLNDYLKIMPPDISNIELFNTGFLHRDTFGIPGYDYQINYVRTLQAPSDNKSNLILDIDVFTEKSDIDNNEFLKKQLEEMRFIKNTIFFDSLTEKTLEMLK